MGQPKQYYDLIASEFIVSQLAREVDVSDHAVFKAAYEAGEYMVDDDFLDAKFQRYMMRQEVPQQVESYCRKVLAGKAPFNGSRGCFLLA